jgi:transposase
VLIRAFARVEEQTGQAWPAPATGKTGMMETREAKAMSLVVAPDQRQARRSARQEIVRQVKLGATASEAQRRCPVPMHRTTVYRLLKRVEREGEDACIEKRHGHPSILRGEVLTFLLDYCRTHASAASRQVQHLVAERFGLCVSVSQLNRVRAAHRLSRKAPPREKKAANGPHDCLRTS